MSAPYRSRSPRWSVLLRIGVGFGAFGLFVMLFAFGGSTIGAGLFGIGVACMLASLVMYLSGGRTRR